MFSCYTRILPRAHLSVCLCLCLSLIFSRRGQAKTEAIVERNKEPVLTTRVLQLIAQRSVVRRRVAPTL